MHPYSSRLSRIHNQNCVCPPIGPQGPRGYSGFNGEPGAQGPQGLQGISGINGSQGAQGSRGLTGIGERGFDANSSKWRSQSPPSNQVISSGRFQAVPYDASFGIINHIKVSIKDFYGIDMTNWFTSLNIKDRISIRNDLQSNIYGIYEVTNTPQIIPQPLLGSTPFVDISLSFISGIANNVGPYIINGVNQGSADFFIGYAITGAQGTSGGGGGGGGSDWDPSFNYYFTKKPDFVIDPSGKYDIGDQRIELTWNLPKQIRAAPNFISAPTNSRQTNVLSPAFRGIPGQAPYYPATDNNHNNQNNILNLIVPSKVTGYYSNANNDPSFNDLNYLPYHQYLGVDYRTRNVTTNPPSISPWTPITPKILGFPGGNSHPKPPGVSKGEQNLWSQTRGLYIVDGIGGDPNEGSGNYYPNFSPIPIQSIGKYIYQLEDYAPFSSTPPPPPPDVSAGSQFQFRVYLTNNSSEILTPTSYDISFNSENPPYWRYKYIPDNSNNFLTFGSPGFATPPRNISNGNGQPSGGPAFQDPPTQTYRTLIIIGANNNNIPFVDPSGSPASISSDSTSPADTSLNIPFNQLTTYSCSVNYGFDISRVYIRDILTPWGEQNNPPILTDFSFTLLSNNIFTNNWTTASNSHFSPPNVTIANNPANVNNTIIYPGFSYTLDNYFMGLNIVTAQTPDKAYTCMFSNSNGLGRGGDGTNNEISYSRMVIKPPSRNTVSNQYTSYLSSQQDLFIETGFQNQNGTTNPYNKQNSSNVVYPANSSSPFSNPIYFFTTGSDYHITLNGIRRCVNNKNNSTSGWIDGTTGETIIGDALSTFGTAGGLSSFILSSVDKSSIITTAYAGAWGSTQPLQVTNSLLELTVSASKDAVTSGLPSIENARLHGWYMGIDVTQATAKGINLSNYPDIAIRNSQPIGGTNYSPYVFTLNQQIDINTSGSASNTPVGQTSQYSLYIAEIEPPITWAPTQHPGVTITMTPEFFGLNRPINSNIAIASGQLGFVVRGTLSDISQRWRPELTLMDGTIQYYTSSSNTIQLQNQNKTFTTPWIPVTPAVATRSELINKPIQVAKSDLQQTSMNYSRNSAFIPQFAATGNYRNNVANTPQLQSYSYEFYFTPNVPNGTLLWWDYTWGSSTPYNGTTGIHFPSGFINFTGTAGSAIQNLITGNGPFPSNGSTTDPTTSFLPYNHTTAINYNQAMWTKDSFKGISQSNSNVEAYIDYSTPNFHEQTKDYSFTVNNGDTVTISYGATSYWYDSNFPPPGGISSANWANVKWINLRIQNPGTTSTGIKYSIVENSSGNKLRLGTEFIIFVKEYQIAAPYGGSYQPNPWGTSLTQTPWLDCMNKGLSASTQGGQNRNLGAAGNGVYDTNNSNLSTKEYAFKTLNATSTSNTVQFIRIGILTGKSIHKINLEYV